MPNPGTEVVLSRVFERVVELAKLGEDPRAYSNSTHTGLRIDTGEYGPIDVAVRHSLDGTPQEYIVCGASVSQGDESPYGRVETNWAVTSDTVAYQKGGVTTSEIEQASLQNVMSAVSKAL